MIHILKILIPVPDFLLHFGDFYPLLHITSIYLSYFAFLVASAAAALYLAQDYFLKNKEAGIIFDQLPNLSFLDQLNYTAVGSGFPIFTISIITGFVWAKHTRGAALNLNQREIYAIVLWLIYALILHVRLSVKMRGRRVAQWSLVAFCVIILSLFGSCR